MKKRIRKGLSWDGRRWAKLEVCWENPDRPGKWIRRRRKVKAETLAEAEHAYQQFREEVLDKKAAPAIPPTVDAYIRANWPISKDAAEPLGKGTEKREWSSLRSSILPMIGSLRLDQIDEVIVEDFRAALRTKRKMGNATVNNRMRILRKCLAHAQRRGRNQTPPLVVPALAAWPTKLKEDEVHNELNPDEVRAFLGAFETGVVGGGAAGPEASVYNTSVFRWSRPLFVCAIELGLSRSDLLGLRWSSVDLEKGVVRIKRKKTGIPAVIGISDLAREALQLCRSRRIVNREFVFLTFDGQPYSETTFTRHFQQAKKIAKIVRTVRPHDLRHTFGSTLVSRGVSLEIVATAMGHDDPRTTRRYSRVSEEAARVAVAEALNRS